MLRTLLKHNYHIVGIISKNDDTCKLDLIIWQNFTLLLHTNVKINIQSEIFNIINETTFNSASCDWKIIHSLDGTLNCTYNVTTSD